jgi:putative Mg2+ transporter-C (MgtC) family protein
MLEILNNYHEVILKLVLAAFLGGIIGIERDKRGRAAGLRTHILVCLGSALFMIISTDIFKLYKAYNATSIIRVDPGRIAAQIITGIGFLGAGAIIRTGIDIRGLTTG